MNEEKNKKRKRKRRRREERKKERSSTKIKKVWNFGFVYGTMNFHTIAWLVACFKPRV